MRVQQHQEDPFLCTRYINEIFAPKVGQRWDNQALYSLYEDRIQRLPLGDDDQTRLLSFVRSQLVGRRSRQAVCEDWPELSCFASRAAAFERAAESTLDVLVEQIAPAAEQAGISFDAVLTTTTTGNLMPGLSYRLARRLDGLIRPDSLMVDLGNVGCTGSMKALNLARTLDASVRNILIVALEMPTTLVDTTGTTLDLWRGNCTFGDGAAALWVSSDPESGSMALALEDLRYRQRAEAGIDLIRWGYRSYYTFALSDGATFSETVRDFVAGALEGAEAGWAEQSHWAIHPAGIQILMRLSRRLGIPSDAVAPSVTHYGEWSNMSSASIMHILKDVAASAPVGSPINMLTMGAGFNVLYGRARRVR